MLLQVLVIVFLSEQNLKRMFPKSWWRLFSTNHSLLENVLYVAEKIANRNVILKNIEKLWTLWMVPFMFLIVSMLWINCVPQRIKLNNICLEFESRNIKHYRIAMTTVDFFSLASVSYACCIKALRLLHFFIDPSVSSA